MNAARVAIGAMRMEWETEEERLYTERSQLR